MKRVKISSYLKKYAVFAIIAPLFMVGEVLVDLLQPKLMSRIVNTVVSSSDLSYVLPEILSTSLKMFGLVVLGFATHSVSAAVASALFFVLTMVLCVLCNFMTIRALDCFIRTRNVINAMKQGNVRQADVSQHWIATVLYILYGLSVAIGAVMLVILLCMCIAHWDEVRASIMNMNYSDLNQVM